MIQSDTAPDNILWMSYLTKECNRQLKWLCEKVEREIDVPQFDSTEHNKNQEQLKRKYEKQGYKVELEKLLVAQYKEYTLGHYYDVVAEKENDRIFIEVKPKDSDYYVPQYLFAQAILRLNKIKGYYYVFEYTTQRIRIKNNYFNSNIVEFLNERLNVLYEINPSMKIGNGCQYCHFSQCINHPKHHTLVR